MIRFVLPSWPPSANNLYINGKRGRALSPAARAWIEETLWHMAGQRNSQRKRGDRPFADSRITLAIRLYGPWRTKAGAWRKRDLSNAIKVLEDCAAKSLGFDDRQVVAIQAEKMDCYVTRCELDVTIMRDINPDREFEEAEKT